MTSLAPIVALADVVKRRRLALDQIPSEDAKLAGAHRYWESKRRDGLLPARRDLDVLDLRPLVGGIHLIDVTAEDPARFSFVLRGTALPDDIDRKVVTATVGSIASETYRQTLIEDYGAAAFSGVPSYHQVVAMIDCVRHSYSRLILPLAEDRRRVNVLMVCVNPRRFADFRL